MKTRGHDKLNADLNVEELEICVPKTCHIDDRSDDRSDRVEHTRKEWRAYLTELGAADVSREPERLTKEETRFGGAGWILKGELAVAHALRVHRRIKDELLRLPGMSAVDVGFAVAERHRKFLNILAIRIHVNDKRAPKLLAKAGQADLTSLRYLLLSIANRLTHSTGTIPLNWEALSQYLPRSTRDEGTAGLETTGQEKLMRSLVVGPQAANLRYPIHSVGLDDLACYPYWRSEGDKEESFEECKRLTICGVPLDILGVEYRPCSGSSPARTRTGVFADPRATSVELSNREQELTGRGRVEPLVGGISIGSTTGQAGTLGAIVWDRTDGKPCMLSNWHVLAGNTSARRGQPVFQPSLFDGGTEDDVVAHLKRWYLGEHGDAALAQLNAERSYASDESLGMWHPLGGTKKPRLNLQVRKWGRTSGFTEGFVDGVQLAVNIDYGGGLSRRFTDQFHIAPLYRGQPVSQPGDSGSLVLAKFEPERLSRCRDALVRICEDSGLYAKLAKKWRDVKAKGGSVRNVVLDLFDEVVNGTTGQDSGELSVTIRKESTGGSLKQSGPLEQSGQISKDDLKDFLLSTLSDQGLDVESFKANMEERTRRQKTRVYLAVGLIFAGDTPGSPFGEFAIASDVDTLAKELQFSLRPVFAPRSSFRRLHTEGSKSTAQASATSGAALAPGALGADPRGQGPTPDPEQSQSGGGSG